MCYSDAMRFQERDGAILSAIYQHDGILSRRHLKALFWPTASLRAVQKRLAKLVANGYLARPTKLHRQTRPIPEPVYWLDWQGILWIAGQTNVTLDPPANAGENQMRKLAKQVRDAGLHWLREPRWNQLAHDLAVTDFQIGVERAIAQLPNLSLELWLHETVFRSDGDVISFQLADRNGNTQKRERRVYPDSFFIIVNQHRSNQGLTSRARLLLELDNATHANTRFGREKIAPGIAYIKSQAYKRRFGDSSGRWLIVTTGVTRMKNLMQQTVKVAGSGAGTFLFTTAEWLEGVNILIEPVWWQVGKEQPVALFTEKSQEES
jgi:hypothetical protein